MNERRARVSTIQSRLAARQDNMRKKLINNNLQLIGSAVDCIRVKTRKTYEDDPVSMIVESADVVNVVFPPLNDVPYRKIKIDRVSHTWQLTSLVEAFGDDSQEKMYTCQIPLNFNIDAEDLLFRIMVDDEVKEPICIMMQVQNLLGTFGGVKMIMGKFSCTIPTFDIPVEIIETVQKMSERRTKLGW